MKYGKNKGVIILCILILVIISLQCRSTQVKNSFNKLLFWGEEKFNSLGNSNNNSNISENILSNLNPNIIHTKGKCCQQGDQIHISEEKKDGCKSCSRQTCSGCSTCGRQTCNGSSTCGRQTCSGCPFKTCKSALDTHPKIPENTAKKCGCSSETEEITCPEPEPCNAQDESSVTLDDYFNLPSKRLPIYPWYSY